MDEISMPALGLAAIGDAELDSRLKRLVSVERRALVLLLAHLAEFDRRKLYADRGHPSLFAYCISELHYSEQGAYKRIQAARAIRANPIVLEALARAQTNLTAIVILAPHFRGDNVRRLLDDTRGLRAREIEKIAAGLSPRPDSADMIRALTPETAPAGTAAAESAATAAPISAEVVSSPPPFQERAGPAQAGASSHQTPPEPNEVLEPISSRRYLFRFCADEPFLGKLERAASLLRLRRGSGMMEAAFGHALDALLNQIDPERRLARRRDTPSAGAIATRPARRRVPQAVRDEVWRRDGGRCTFLSLEGARCAATTWLEVDHIVPFCRGGRSDDPGNLRLLCRAHNQLEARRKLKGMQRRWKANYP